jgi:hypothetical protein
MGRTFSSGYRARRRRESAPGLRFPSIERREGNEVDTARSIRAGEHPHNQKHQQRRRPNQPDALLAITLASRRIDVPSIRCSSHRHTRTRRPNSRRKSTRNIVRGNANGSTPRQGRGRDASRFRACVIRAARALPDSGGELAAPALCNGDAAALCVATYIDHARFLSMLDTSNRCLLAPVWLIKSRHGF